MKSLRCLSRVSFFLLLIYMMCGSQAIADVPTFREIKETFSDSEAQVLDRHGQLIQVLRVNSKVRHLGWVRISDVSPSLKDAVIQAEDRRFYSHHGVDWLALGKAAERHLWGKSDRGASTISMQVAALLNQGSSPFRGKRRWDQKVSQVIQAVELERTWMKDEIFEAYLNLIFFRGELQGVQSASRGLFGKDPSGLNHEESLVLAALIRSPEAKIERVVARACDLGRAMSPVYSCAELERQMAQNGLEVRSITPSAAFAPHAARLALKAGAHQLTLDRRVQVMVLEILKRHVLSLKDRNLNDAAALVLDNSTGEVLAYVGSIGSLSDSPHVDGVQAKRQAGSTLKPFLYSIALERRILTAASRMDDTPADISLGDGAVYRPRDFDHEFHGSDVSLRTSLASSLNVPAVRTLKLIGFETFVERLRMFGFETLRSSEFYGPSLALGTADVSLWELTNAYQALANQGRWSEATLVQGESRRWSRIVASGAAFIVGDILADRGSRALTFGFDNPMSLSFWAAAKTGTSKDMRDNWCVGFTSRYTVGVWAGNFSGAPMWNVTGVSGAAPAWSEIMQGLHRIGLDRPPHPPANVIRVADEWYLKGTEPNSIDGSSQRMISTLFPAKNQAKIIYPVEGLLIANDPDIPAHLQRVFFESDNPDPTFHWELNGQELGTASAPFGWKLGKPGKYSLKLVSRSGTVLDQLQFSVRGHDNSDSIPPSKKQNETPASGAAVNRTGAS